ncbi:hypothetical protein HGB07_02890 [Candidatus Roizmanbacteria bacterium]|nr:hypothetical protein [Candidatus Roizmanbacteria bacterium]
MSLKKIAIIVGVVFVLALGFISYKLLHFYQAIYKPTTKTVTKKPAPEKTIFNILIAGYGGAGHDGAYLTDTMIAANIDLKTKKVHMLSLPRDTWVDIPTKSGADYHEKINAVYQMELFPKDYPDVQTLDANVTGDVFSSKVEEVTGLKMDNYVFVDFTGFKKAIDILGGIDVNVEKTFDDYEYPIDGKEKDLCGKDDQFHQVEKYLGPISADLVAERDTLFKDHPDLQTFFDNITKDPAVAFPCRYEHLHFDKGLTHMTGETALKYARSRHSLQDGTDFGRAARQQRVIEAVKDKVVSVGFLPKIIPLMDELSQHIKVDISPSVIQKFIGEAKNAGLYKIKTLVLSDSNYLKSGTASTGAYILTSREGIDKWDSVKLAVSDFVNDVEPTPTATLSGILKSPTQLPKPTN